MLDYYIIFKDILFFLNIKIDSIDSMIYNKKKTIVNIKSENPGDFYIKLIYRLNYYKDIIRLNIIYKDANDIYKYNVLYNDYKIDYYIVNLLGEKVIHNYYNERILYIKYNNDVFRIIKPDKTKLYYYKYKKFLKQINTNYIIYYDNNKKIIINKFIINYKNNFLFYKKINKKNININNIYLFNNKLFELFI